MALFAEQSKIIDFPPTAVGQGKSNEWYTPSKYIEAAREVMGGIDLDPASCELANQTVKASRYYSKEDDGLSKPWYGRVWLNPPYSNPAGPRNSNVVTGGNLKGPTGDFIAKLVTAYKSERVKQAIVCANADMTRTWFQSLWEGVICFASPQVQFIRSDGTKEHHFYSTAFVYLGPHEQKFIDVFSQFGRIAKAVDTPRQKIQPLRLWEGVN